MIFTKKNTSNEVTESRTVELGGAQQVDVRIVQEVGELTISGGAAPLMSGTFTFPDDLRPTVDYRVANGIGMLHIDHERPRLRSSRGDRMHWDIALNNDVPTSLGVNQATGSCNLDLSTLNLTALKVERATGSADVDLSGAHPGLRAVTIDSATGSVDVNLSGEYRTLDALKVGAATGDVMLDLSGAWGCSLDGKISTATGAVKLRLPKDIGVEVTLKAAVSRVNAHGLMRDGNTWHNAAFGSAAETMRLRISSSVASVTLEVVD